MLFATLITAHCSASHLRIAESEYVETRAGEESKNRFPMDHPSLRFENPDDGVCHGTPARTDLTPPTLTPGQSLGFATSPRCFPGTDDVEETFELAGETVTEAGGGEGDGGARHGGGYCEVSITFTESPGFMDFVVISRWEETCPDSRMDFDFTLPENLPSGNAILMWTWHAGHVNQFYSTCIDVVVEGNAEGGLQGLCPIVYNLNNDDDETTHFFYAGETQGDSGKMDQPGNPADITSVSTTVAPAMSCQKQPTQFPDIYPGVNGEVPAGPQGVELPGGEIGIRRESGVAPPVTRLSTYSTSPPSSSIKKAR